MTYAEKIASPEFAELARLQNHPALVGRDILTFVAFLDTPEELARHLEAARARVGDYVGTRAVARALRVSLNG